MKLDTSPIAAIATAPGRGGIGVVRASGKSLAPLRRRAVPRRHADAAPRHLPAVHARRRQRHRPGHRPLLQRARIPTPAKTCWNCRAMAARWCCRCCSRACWKRAREHRPAPGRTGRIHAPRLPQRQARPGPGRSRGRPDRRLHRSGRASRRRNRCRARFRRPCTRWSSRPSTCACWSKPRSTSRKKKSTSWKNPNARGQLAGIVDALEHVFRQAAQGALLREGLERGAGRPAERRQIVAAERAGRLGRGHRHADRRHHARQGQRDHPDRRHPAEHHRHGRHPRDRRRRSTWSSASASSAPGAKSARPT